MGYYDPYYGGKRVGKNCNPLLQKRTVKSGKSTREDLLMEHSLINKPRRFKIICIKCQKNEVILKPYIYGKPDKNKFCTECI